MKTELSEQKHIDDLDRLWVKQTELTALAERDAYLAGFKFGVRMMVEVLAET